MDQRSDQIVLIVCDKEEDARNRKARLINEGLSNTTIEKADTSIGYDAIQFSDGARDDPAGKWLVIGRRPPPPG